MQRFVPAADEVWHLQNRKDAECRLFQAIAEQGHYAGRSRPSTTRQGIYACTPSGRFLASDKGLAQAAKVLQIDLRREPDLVFGTWQALLPKGPGAPRLAYAAPKKPAAAEALTIRMVKVLGERRNVVEEMQALIELAGRTEELYIHFGIDLPDEDIGDLPGGPGSHKKGGLLDQ